VTEETRGDALSAVLEARDLLNSIDPDALNDDNAGLLWNATELIDNLLLNLDSDDLATALGGREVSQTPAAGGETAPVTGPCGDEDSADGGDR